jgi:hypothetical protein
MKNEEQYWREYLSPLKLALLAINGVCFGDRCYLSHKYSNATQ